MFQESKPARPRPGSALTVVKPGRKRGAALTNLNRTGPPTEPTEIDRRRLARRRRIEQIHEDREMRALTADY